MLIMVPGTHADLLNGFKHSTGLPKPIFTIANFVLEFFLDFNDFSSITLMSSLFGGAARKCRPELIAINR